MKLATLIEYIDSSPSGTDIVPIFDFADIGQLHNVRLEEIGVVIVRKLNSTLLKNWILTAIKIMQAHHRGSVALLIFNECVWEVLKPAMFPSCDDEGLVLANVNIIIWRD